MDLERPKTEDGSVDIDMSEFEEEDVHPKGDPAMRGAEAREGAETGLGRVIEPEALQEPGPEAEAQKEVMDDVIGDLMDQPPFASLFEGKEGVKKDFAFELRRALAGEMGKYLDTGRKSPMEMRLSREELYRTLLTGAREVSKDLLKRYEDRLLGDSERRAA